MKWLKIFFNFYINSSIHVALAVYSFLRITELYFNLPYNESLNYFIFYGTITGYNFVKYAGVAKLYHKKLTNSLKSIQLFSLICFLLMCYYGLKVNTKTLLLLMLFGLLTFLYAIPFWGGLQKNLRSISFLKILIVAIVWSGVTVLIPLYDVADITNSKIALLFIQRLLFVIVLILPFDIRDLKNDALSLQTIPRKIGVAKTKKLGFVLLMVCVFLEFLITSQGSFKRVFFLIFVLAAVLLMRAEENQPKYYSSFFVEAIPIIWWFLL